MSGTTLERIFANEPAQHKAAEDAESAKVRISTIADKILRRLQERTQTPVGISINGKPGFVRSPFAPDRGEVDVRGFVSGTPVRDPFTGKVFLVP
jgi:hypothetical protein